MAESTHSVDSHCEEIEKEEQTVKGQEKSDNFLSQINESFYQSKADQILRLLKDQEDLNFRFHECALVSENEDDDGDSAIDSDSDNDSESDSISDTSIQETEKRLAIRLSLHRQQGGRSKTSMGFYNDAEKLGNNYSSDEGDTKMADENRQINTRVNRPKSSYVRRRTTVLGDSTDDNLEDESLDTISTQRRCRSSRPQSRLGNRSGDPRQRRQRVVLNENSYNFQAPPASPNNEIIDSSNYDKYAHTKTSGGILQRQRTRVRGFCDDPEPEVKRNLERQKTVADISSTQAYSSSDEARDEFTSSKQMHRRQQFRNSRQNRPTSENVYLVRQRTESRLMASQSHSMRPKSDKTMIQQPKGKKAMLSIDTNPLQAAQNSGFQPAPSSIKSSQSQTQARYPPYGTAQQRPMSRRSHGRQEIPINPRGTGVLPSRTQPIGLMKLPPLDPAVAKRAERMVIAARETCA